VRWKTDSFDFADYDWMKTGNANIKKMNQISQQQQGSQQQEVKFQD